MVSSVERLDPNLLDKDLVGIKLVTGGSITVTIKCIFLLKRLFVKGIIRCGRSGFQEDVLLCGFRATTQILQESKDLSFELRARTQEREGKRRDQNRQP